MKRSAPLQRRTPLKQKSNSETAQIKERIQALLRAAVIQRDRGCIFRHYPEAGACGGYRKDGALILQADHLNTRARNISYGDVRLAVCACQRHHIFWKPQHPDQYMRIAREHIGPERSALLDRVIADQTPYRFFLSDWQKSGGVASFNDPRIERSWSSVPDATRGAP